MAPNNGTRQLHNGTKTVYGVALNDITDFLNENES